MGVPKLLQDNFSTAVIWFIWRVTGSEPFHQRQFRKKQRQVRVKTRHQGNSADGMTGKNMPEDQRPNHRAPSCGSCTPRSISR